MSRSLHRYVTFFILALGSLIGLAQKLVILCYWLTFTYLSVITSLTSLKKGTILKDSAFTKPFLLAAHKKCYVLISSENICCTAPKSPFFSSPLLSVKSSVQFMVCIEDPLLGSSLMIIELLSSHQLWNPSFSACLAA